MSESYSQIVRRKFSAAVSDYGMLDFSDEGSSVLVGFSGGADSSVLLHLLDETSKQEKHFRLSAVHVNHGIRGEEALRDQKFCEQTTKRLGIQIFTEFCDIPAISENTKLGLEEAARNERYRIFDEICRRENITRIATAHNASDNLETVIFNLARGTGLHGLCGIPPVRGNIIRPLIYCTKEEILGFCKENGIEYVTDSTNSDSVYSRNYIRSEIVPKLKHLNPAVEKTVARTCRVLRKDDEYLNRQARQTDLSVTDFSLLSRKLQNEYKEAGGAEPLEHERIVEIADLISVGSDTRISLHGKLDFFIRSGNYGFEPHQIDQRPVFHRAVGMGITEIPEADGCFFIPSLSDHSENEKIISCLKNVYKLSMKISASSDKILNGLCCRSRMNGDRYVSGGMTRTVKKQLQSCGLSKEDRDSLPFLCDKNGILWIPGVGAADRFTTDTPQTEYYFFKGKN